MIKMLLIAPYKNFADAFEKIFIEHNEKDISDLYTSRKYSLEIVNANSSADVRKLKLDYEVLISRGLVSEDLKSLQYFLPVVEVPIAAGDLVNSMKKAKSEFNPRKVAVIGSQNMVMGVEKYGALFDMEVNEYLLTSHDKIKTTIQHTIEEGANVVIGGSLTCMRAKELNVPYILLESGPESIWYSIGEAKRVAYTCRKFKEKTEMLKAILEKSYEGIIATNEMGYIEVFNNAASRILSLDCKNVLGKSLKQVLPTLKKDISTPDADPFHTEIIKHNEKLINIDIKHMSLRGETIGYIYTLQEVSKIQELESRIRKKIYSRGHIAKYSFDDIIGESECMKETIQTAKMYSRVDSNLLITGDTGTGKELFAESIHNYSERRNGPFVAVNCAALSESLLKSELFGYADGAFTGAAKGGKIGLFELAHHGTIFLDEISEIPLSLQGVLLRVIEEREIRRIGHDRVIPIDVRVISAANKDLFNLIEKGTFREDLYYRLDILTLNLPGLSRRREDITHIAEYWVKYFCKEFSMDQKIISEKAKIILSEFDYPGNVRQLRNLCERIVVLSQDRTISIEDVRFVLRSSKSRSKKDLIESQQTFPAYFSLKSEMENHERTRVLGALKKAKYNKEKAAEMLGFSRTTLWRRMKSLDLI